MSENKESSTKKMKDSTKLLIFLGACWPLLHFTAWISRQDGGSSQPESTLPSHTVVENNVVSKQFHFGKPVKNGTGRQIRVNASNPSITRAKCRHLIYHYRQFTGDCCQIVVQKESPSSPGLMLPWCLDNMDGEGIVFQDFMFTK